MAPARKPRIAAANQLRLGLCCQFVVEPIRFYTTTATSLLKLKDADRKAKLARLCAANAESLLATLQYCAAHGIGCFRINSQILPIKTHPQAGYTIDELSNGEEVVIAFRRCGEFAAQNSIRLVFHPDQFVVLNSLRDDVVQKSVAELEYQAEVAEWVGADVINIHGGGAFGDKQAALERFARNLDQLSDRVRSRLTLENDDRVYTPADLLPLCRSAGIPLVYDAHHHRCLPDGLTVEQATAEAITTWNREPLFHISSPFEGWEGRLPQRHHDYICIADFPSCWRSLAATVEVEAKAKELAVERLRSDLNSEGSQSHAATAEKPRKTRAN